ncbi:alpha-2-macroglobulin [Tenacibaculum sp. 47A_GOM-205m]|uniref:alpha-2-macroglobulin family protein n=1 Tax=Tenacibaculum sp. 47A_GOM-205m TaxID=1380384 RepID=UPI00048D81CA|nr:alpha-2-macroglobulin family protein [Tenacibaculum sp. 47A_GOM-205m]
MKKLTSILLMILFSTLVNAQENYKDLWEKVHKYELDNLPKSALKVVNTIYEKAEKSNNSPQIIKSLFYKSKYSLTLEENAQLKIINQFKKQIDKSSFPIQNVLENILANLYWQYFNENRWKFYNRTQTQNKVDENDFRTWDLDTLFAEIHCHYQNSLENERELQKTDIYTFGDIIHAEKDSKKYRPTLFDFLAHNALAFYKTTETNITKPTYQFKIDNPQYISSVKKFPALKLTSKDDLSLQFNALKIYQKLISFHLKNNNLDALVDVDIQRLHFVNQHATFSDKQELFLQTLTTSVTNYNNKEIGSLYNYEIARIYNQQVNLYKTDKNKDFRFKNREALAICNEVIQQFPKSLAAKKCKTLQQQITTTSLNLLSEIFVPTNTPSRILVTYNNIDSLYFSAYKINQKQLEELQKIYKEEDRINFIKKLTKTASWNSNLRNEKDYLQHTTEVVVPKLNQGNYLIVAHKNTTFNTTSLYATANLQVTNLVLVESNNKGTRTYQVVDRMTGTPIKNAQLLLQNKQSRYGKKIHKLLTTDKNGFALFKSEVNYSNVYITVTTKDDTAIFGNYYLYKHHEQELANNKEQIRIKPFIFTDRSIYRPGQTVYFKTIFIQQKREKSTPFTNEYVQITLNSVNGEEVKTLDLKLNEYGAASGEIILPNTGLTGEYWFDIDESEKHESTFYDSADFDFDQYDYITRISVEEYKRPKFETEFKPITKTYKVNDSITVNGFAKAFAGSNITDAKVVYRVHRKVQYPIWWYWRKPQFISEAQEITHGELTTDAQGNFEITFKALPDESVDKESLPVFEYEVTADVTDVNGETRSATSIVKVGYHALLASIQIPSTINKDDKSSKIKISSKNLNGEFVPAEGSIKVYKLQAPKNPLRERPWDTPDYQDISETEFRKLFPHDAYTSEEENPDNWRKGTLVFEQTFNTQESKEITLTSYKNWNSGKYIVVLESKDEFGQKVTDKTRFTLTSKDERSIADSQLFVYNTNKTVYNPNDKIELQIGSASKDVTIIVQIEKSQEIIKTKLVHVSNNLKTIKIPITKEDIGGFAIKYYFVNYNSFVSGTIPISVPNEQETISIETNTFRDKLQPGAEETWSFTIKNDKNNKVTAEVLASMYDASLDEFKPHHWEFNPIVTPTYYSYGNNANAYQSFGNEHFRVFNRRYPKSYYPTQQYDQYNWFGFSFNNHRWVQKRFTQQLARAQKTTRSNYDRIITGVVQDESGPLPGVTVLIKGTGFGTETDFDGKYSIKVKKGDVLVFSFVGMKTEERQLNEASEVILTSDNLLEEVVTVAYGTTNDQPYTALKGKVAGVEIVESQEADSVVRIRGNASTTGKKTPIYIVDGKIVDSFNIASNDIISSTVLKANEAIALYGEKAKFGAIVIVTKAGQSKLDNELAKVKARKNLQETAFFYPHLQTDKEGNITFSFTTPEALTRWKLQLLAHTKELQSTTKTLTTVTQKELMVIPNAPRFLREGDQITLNTKIANISDKNLQGNAQLVLTDAVTGKEINLLDNSAKNQSFSVDVNGNTQVSWNLSIPDTYQAIQYKVVAKAGDFSDGEKNVLPVLSNRMLVTETLPIWVRSNQTKTFTLDKLKNNTSNSLKNHKLTLEVTSNPAWYAVQALPYLMEYPYECSEQTFARYYSNTLASHIANSNPRIQEVFNAWKSSDALLSNLEKNQELKSLIIQETPWLRDAQSETEQKKRIALLFDLNKMKNEQQNAINKLSQMQLNNGGFPWFKGSDYPNAYITNHIATGFGHLQKLGVTNFDKSTTAIVQKSVSFLDAEIEEVYKKLLENAERIKTKKGQKKYEEFLQENHLNYFIIQYLYMRSFYKNIDINSTTKTAIEYYKNQASKYWKDFNLYGKGQIALLQFRNGNTSIANKIIASLKENSITSEELGMYWKENQPSWHWYQAPIETQSLLIEVFAEIENNTETVDNLKIWLLKNKQTNRWKTTKATTEAVYALLLQGSDWISITDMVDVKIGNLIINPSKLENTKIEAGTGYFKTSWNGSEITPNMSTISVSKKGKGIAWGGLYWQYFEDLDKITSVKNPLNLNKKLFKKINTDTGKKLQEITKDTRLKVGDIVTVRIELRSDRNMEFVHMKDMRASGVEPINVLSQYKWQDGLGYYESTKDAATNFFFERLPKGIYVFEYDVRVNNAGNFSNGVTTIQSMYAPEFASHSKGERLLIK